MVVDVGAGVGRPLLHAWVARGCKTVGYEVDNVKCMKGEHMVSVMLEKLGERWVSVGLSTPHAPVAVDGRQPCDRLPPTRAGACFRAS